MTSFVDLGDVTSSRNAKAKIHEERARLDKILTKAKFEAMTRANRMPTILHDSYFDVLRGKLGDHAHQKTTFVFDFSAKDLINLDGLFGTSDPFLELFHVSKTGNRDENNVYAATEVVDSDLSPVWSPKTVSAQDIEKNGLWEAKVLAFKLQLGAKIMDKNKKKAPDFMGKCDVELNFFYNSWSQYNSIGSSGLKKQKGGWFNKSALIDAGTLSVRCKVQFSPAAASAIASLVACCAVSNAVLVTQTALHEICQMLVGQSSKIRKVAYNVAFQARKVSKYAASTNFDAYVDEAKRVQSDRIADAAHAAARASTSAAKAASKGSENESFAKDMRRGLHFFIQSVVVEQRRRMYVDRLNEETSREKARAEAAARAAAASSAYAASSGGITYGHHTHTSGFNDVYGSSSHAAAKTKVGDESTKKKKAPHHFRKGERVIVTKDVSGKCLRGDEGFVTRDSGSVGPFAVVNVSFAIPDVMLMGPSTFDISAVCLRFVEEDEYVSLAAAFDVVTADGFKDTQENSIPAGRQERGLPDIYWEYTEHGKNDWGEFRPMESAILERAYHSPSKTKCRIVNPFGNYEVNGLGPGLSPKMINTRMRQLGMYSLRRVDGKSASLTSGVETQARSKLNVYWIRATNDTYYSPTGLKCTFVAKQGWTISEPSDVSYLKKIADAPREGRTLVTFRPDTILYPGTPQTELVKRYGLEGRPQSSNPGHPYRPDNRAKLDRIGLSHDWMRRTNVRSARSHMSVKWTREKTGSRPVGVKNTLAYAPQDVLKLVNRYFPVLGYGTQVPRLLADAKMSERGFKVSGGEEEKKAVPVVARPSAPVSLTKLESVVRGSPSDMAELGRQLVRCMTSLQGPSHWVPLKKGETDALVTLSPRSTEYQMAMKHFRKTLSKTVTKIERVQNFYLWQRYLTRKMAMLQKNQGVVNERLLFHGTRNTKTTYIWDGMNACGFDPRLGTGYYGKGAYFAEKAKYSHAYVHKIGGGLGQMFLAGVLCGEHKDYGTTLAKTNKRCPPLPSHHRRYPGAYDSVKGGPHSGSYMYIVYKSDQSYPLYLYTYRC